jgi:nitrite reductase (NO-forming)
MFVSPRHRAIVRLLSLTTLLMLLAACSGAPTGSNADHQHAIAQTTALQPDPNAPPPPFVNAAAPALMSGTLHQLDITVEEKDMTIVPGIVQHVWTFNGSIPAPALRVRVGDTIRAHFTNLATNKMAHSLDFHASEVAANDEMRTINPDEQIDVEWQANYAGVWMYHCVTGPPVLHVASGMYGMMIVEPKAGLQKVDKEFVLIQNEWYFGPQQGMISMEKAAAGAPSPDYMAFNGIPDQYVDHPLRMNKGERGRIFVLNAGPNLESSFHIVGMVFDTVIKEGVSLLPNNAGHYGSQAVDLAPAQGAIVEFVAPEDGVYEFVTHTFNFHDHGAHGIIQVGDGKPKH